MPAAVHSLYMGLLSDSERDFATAVAHLSYVNPFLAERIEWERRALGAEHLSFDEVWHSRGDLAGQNPNEALIAERGAALAEELRERLVNGVRATAEELDLYQDVALYLLYYRYQARFYAVLMAAGRRPDFGFYEDFAVDCERFFAPAAGRRRPIRPICSPATFQTAARSTIRSTRSSAARCRRRDCAPRSGNRSSLYDLRRYQRSLYRRLGDVTTLVTGPSGTGKEWWRARSPCRAIFLTHPPATGE